MTDLSSEDVVVGFQGRVVSVQRELIPKLYLAKIVSDDGEIEVEMDMHEDVVVYNEGQRVTFRITRKLPNYRDGIDFVGRATVVSFREKEGKYSVLLSIGGLLVMVHTKQPLPLVPTEKVYVWVQPL